MNIIRSKECFPFIYFLIEPNIVFVYKVETLRYLTLKEMPHIGEWQTFELNHEEEFDTFNHEDSTPLTGRFYVVSQDTNNIMLKKINQLIHRQRMANLQENSKRVVHLVCSEAAAGALRFGLNRPKTVIGFQAFFSVGPIWHLDQKIGQTQRFDWLNENINMEQDDYELENNFNNTLLEIAEIPEDSPIYL